MSYSVKVGKKGSKSKTHPGDMNFTTKRGDKDHHIGGHDVKELKKPYQKNQARVPQRKPKRVSSASLHRGRTSEAEERKPTRPQNHVEGMAMRREVMMNRKRAGLIPRTFSGRDGAVGIVG